MAQSDDPLDLACNAAAPQLVQGTQKAALLRMSKSMDDTDGRWRDGTGMLGVAVAAPKGSSTALPALGTGRAGGLPVHEEEEDDAEAEEGKSGRRHHHAKAEEGAAEAENDEDELDDEEEEEDGSKVGDEEEESVGPLHLVSDDEDDEDEDDDLACFSPQQQQPPLSAPARVPQVNMAGGARGGGISSPAQQPQQQALSPSQVGRQHEP